MLSDTNHAAERTDAMTTATCPVCHRPLPAASRDCRVTASGIVVCDRASCEEAAADLPTPAATRYEIQTRTPGAPWQREASSDDYETRAAAESDAAKLEPENDDGDALEYRVVEILR